MSDFFIKKGDTSPALTATLQDASGNAIDLTGATVVVNMAPRPGHSPIKINRAAVTILDEPGGIVEYDWQAADTDTAGVYDLEFEVTYSGGTIETFPQDGFNIIEVTEDLA